MLWLSILVALAFSGDLIFSVVYKESVAKGVTVLKKQSPYSYMVSVGVKLLVLVLSIIGIVYYY
jgi:hypothetical protein